MHTVSIQLTLQEYSPRFMENIVSHVFMHHELHVCFLDAGISDLTRDMTAMQGPMPSYCYWAVTPDFCTVQDAL